MVPSPTLLLVSALALASVAFSAALPPWARRIRSDATSHDKRVSYLMEIRDIADTLIPRVRTRGEQFPRADTEGAQISSISINKREQADTEEAEISSVSIDKRAPIPRANPGTQVPGVDKPEAKISGVSINKIKRARSVSIPRAEAPGPRIPRASIPEEVQTAGGSINKRERARSVSIPRAEIPGAAGSVPGPINQ